ncbi:hypothetical protein [Nonomuraea sp. NPDC005650]|uniref:hypothetical protein n=1 Tax=Nonomuraea sp. NPDC005650 TaxID=3157045 RepID=UPI0033B83705
MQFVNEDGDIAVDGEIGAAFLTTVTGVSVTLHGTEGADVPLGYVVVLLKPLAPVTTCQLTDKSGSVMEDRTAPFRTAP